MSTAAATARQMLERTGEHPVISVYLDLDPSQFATAPARATQVRSLIDEAERDGRLDKDALSHADRSALTADLERLEAYLGSDEPPVSGARALAVFCSGQDDLFEAIPLGGVIAPRVVIAPTPLIEPLVAGPDEGRVAVVLISHRSGRILLGNLRELQEAEDVSDDVHGRTARGGLSQHNYERSIEADVQHHLRHVAEELYRSWQQERFSRLVLGGTAQDVDQFASELPNDLRPAARGGAAGRRRRGRHPSPRSATRSPPCSIALGRRPRSRRSPSSRTAWAPRVAPRAASRTRARPSTSAASRPCCWPTTSPRRASAVRAAACSIPRGRRHCPADGEATTPVADLREAAVEAAVLQDAASARVRRGV